MVPDDGQGAAMPAGAGQRAFAPLLSVEGLTTVFDTPSGPLRAVDGVDLAIGRGEVLAVVGESGCGKTVLALSILGLVSPPGRIVSGRAVFGGQDLLALPEGKRRTIRGSRASMIFQEPMTSLNPVLSIGDQVAEPVRVHRRASRREALAAAGAMLDRVGLSGAGRRLRAYPHELSGGQRQRVMIAMALILSPELLIADEPTTALDVTVQRQILDLMLGLARDTGTAIALVTHNLGVVAETAENVAVMYSGRLVEYGAVADFLREPAHPYGQGLLASLPRLSDRGRRLTPIPGTVPSLADLPTGCHFHPRCPRAFAPCARDIPPLFDLPDGRRVRCWLYG
ncbi:oligopeptide/dipeptide ABC transporter, ATPase subunit [Solidesulfovibrio carbinoliphilus subsp. oakridgensis]|uniref:Oligopeptide/dipeptide ABC transporter, ATPase subunit n=1 Tax=Solidesulfovibrio carbinoliphilus subsp. oakridgensis TaxID=694327 RepID=G7QAJ0_9BACT|nr:ABC transporter ATP-binding protein [Solidesulfovibrio carbinoliphilus]EHJ48743.1 oligopeptide/dipeptide ABC transporter, ATPase subunit [Solidesulfovibrio carbinoliphilus subsp. oakridgensis]